MREPVEISGKESTTEESSSEASTDVEANTKKEEIESITSPLLSNAFLYALQIGNIMAWYWTNGMNGIVMQSYAGQVNDPSHKTNATLRFLSTFTITSVATCVQLLLGALIGRLLLLGLNRDITWAQITSSHWFPLSTLHAVGSLATNLGFMYGKASLVQVLKLLEPFETFVLSQVLFREGTFSVGVVSSMLVVVGAAMSLLKLQSTPPAPQAVMFALVSGLTLSCRNVLQRKHHHVNHPTVSSASSSSSSKPQPPQHLSKLEKSVVQFTQLSFYSALWTGAIAMVCVAMIQPYWVAPSARVLVWHPLYNVFSMITLGFCSALTHSLLNAGKRVFAICMTMIWFADEGLNPATLAGLFLVGVGGSWYSWESKRKEQ
jgi:drug/metabolite transporter (DMT)-like permease